MKRQSKKVFKEVDDNWDWLLSQDLDQLEHKVQVIVCGTNENRTEVGIHLHNPTSLDDAMQVAYRDLYPAIYCHFDNVSQLKRRQK